MTSTARRRSTGSRPRRLSLKACQSAASCGAPPCKASMTAAPMPRSSGSTIMWRCRRRMNRASACGRSWPSAPCSAPARSSGRIVFGDNDRPGIMLAGAVRAYVNRYGVAPGKRAVIFADHDDACPHRDRPRRCRRRCRRGDRRQERRLAARQGRCRAGKGALSAGRCDHARARRPGRHRRRSEGLLAARPSDSRAIWSPCRAAGTRASISPPISTASRNGARRLPRWSLARCRRA